MRLLPRSTALGPSAGRPFVTFRKGNLPMRRIVLLAILGLLVAACTDQAPQEPTAPPSMSSSVSSCATAAQIRVQIGKLFPLGGGLIIAQVSFDVIALKLRAGRTTEARRLTRGLIDFTTGRFAAGALFGGKSTTTLTKVATLTSSLECFVGLPQAIPPGATDVGVAVVSPTQTTATTVLTPSSQAGIQVDPADVAVPTLITVYQVPGPLLTTLNQFGPYYQFTASADSFANPVLTGVCTSGSGGSLRLAHNVPDPNPTTIEILPFQSTSPLGLGCVPLLGLGSSQDGGNFAIRGLRTLGREISGLLSPEPLSAAVLSSTGVGGTTKKLSTFGVVDAQVVHFQASGYRALLLECGEGCDSPPAGWETPTFDDSSWGPAVQAAFGLQGSCGLPVSTPWPGASGGVPDILVRKHFTAPLGTTSVSIQLAIDNDAQVFVNGHNITGTASIGIDLTGFARHENCPSTTSPDPAFVFTIDTSGNRLNIGGDNVIAVHGRDRGDQTYLDLKATLVPEPPAIP